MEDMIDVVVLDTQTGERSNSKDEEMNFSYWWWSDGNGSCDCNRALLFDRPDDDSGLCAGGKRYVIVAATDAQGNALSMQDLRELNQSYPDLLVEEHVCALLS